jgi:diguanylate cyclase (GGDEF)-like protein/putative nucleotidyltransferase with HDIG domain
MEAHTGGRVAGVPLARVYERIRRMPAFGPRVGRPPSQDVVLQARSIAIFFLAGAALVLVSLLLPGPPERDQQLLLIAISVALSSGLLYFAVPQRLPRFAIKAQPFLGYTLIALCIWAAGGQVAPAYMAFLFWPPVVYVYLFEPRRAVWQLAYGLTLCTGVFLIEAPPYAALYVLMFSGASVMLALLVWAVRSRLEGLVLAEADAARTDLLTGLPNHRGFDDRLEAEISSSAREDGCFALFLAELEWFDVLTDRRGRSNSDEALQRAAATMSRTLAGAQLGRIGGKEFGVILPGVDPDSGLGVAERLRRAIGGEFAQDLIPLTVSCGVVAYPRHGRDAATLMRFADEALRASRRLGGNQSTLHCPNTITALRSAGPDLSEADSGSTLSAVLTLVDVLDMRHASTAEHSLTVARYAYQIAQAMGLSPERVDRLRLAGILHDIGKIGIADAILLKGDAMTPEEYAEIQRHPELGARLLANAGLPDIAAWVLAHHERPDGSGYPEGLAADEIPSEARILSVADAFEAMIAERVYSPAMPRPEAIEELRRNSGTQFDTDVVAAFVSVVETRPVRA